MYDLKTVILRKRYENAANVFSVLEDEKYAIIKGEPLALQAYGKTGTRHVGDIDVLTSRNNLRSLIGYLEKDGFRVKEVSREDRIASLIYSHQILPYTKKSSSYGDVVIDVNYDIFWGEYEGKRINIDSFLADTIEKSIYGIVVKTLPPLKAMIQLVLHHYKDMNSIFLLATRKSIKYDMFKDVYFLLKNNLEDITIDKLYEMSAEYEIVPYMFYVLYFTGEIFHDEIMNQYIEVFRTGEGEELLDCYGLCEKERKKWKCDFKMRLEANKIYDLIKEDLTESDKEKIVYNQRLF